MIFTYTVLLDTLSACYMYSILPDMLLACFKVLIKRKISCSDYGFMGKNFERGKLFTVFFHTFRNLRDI